LIESDPGGLFSKRNSLIRFSIFDPDIYYAFRNRVGNGLCPFIKLVDI